METEIICVGVGHSLNAPQAEAVSGLHTPFAGLHNPNGEESMRLIQLGTGQPYIVVTTVHSLPPLV